MTVEGAVTVNGYAIEPGGAGGWWVWRPGPRPLAWRFATRHEAVRFAHRLRPAAPPGPPAPAPADAAALRDRLVAWLDTGGGAPASPRARIRVVTDPESAGAA